MFLFSFRRLKVRQLILKILIKEIYRYKRVALNQCVYDSSDMILAASALFCSCPSSHEKASDFVKQTVR
jgi:hypothetical protein